MKSTRTAGSLTLAVAFLIAGCDDRGAPTASSAGGPPPAFEIQDAGHHSGNAHFYFLPPVVPSLPSFSGVFDGSLTPEVDICQWADLNNPSEGACALPLVARFTTTAGSGSEKVRVDLATQSYVVNWRTDRFALDVTKIYRIRVLVAGTELGHADVLVATKWTQLRDANTNEYVPVLIGTTLAIKFRIEQGAIFVVGRSGSTVTALAGRVTLVIPSGALTSDVGITVGSTDAVPLSYRVAPGSAVELGPSGTVFAKPVQLAITYDPATLPAGFLERALRLHTAIGAQWRPVVGSTLDLREQRVTGAINHLSSYGAVSWQWDSITANGDLTPYTCGLSGGQAYCWGDNALGQLGTGQVDALAPNPTPLAVSGGLTFQSVSAGDSGGTCGIVTGGAAYCWGSNVYGQLGNGSNNDSPIPVAVIGGLSFRSVSTGFAHSCGVTLDDVAYCWGYNSGPTPAAVPGGLPWRWVSAGRFHDCGISQRMIAYCWGRNDVGQLGDGSSADQPAPVPVLVDSGVTFQSIAAGGDHTCGISFSVLYCWGENDFGELGNGSTVGPELCDARACSRTRVRVLVTEPGLVFVSLTAGWGSSCGVIQSWYAYCWGANSYGQLGNGSTAASPTLTRVFSPSAGFFRVVSAGVTHTCGITAFTGEAYCWGSNQHGELGDGTTTSTTAPVAVVIP